MTETNQDGKAVRVSFRLLVDEDGYPPADWENLWAQPLGNDRYQLDNTPFFAVGVSLGDVVHAIDDGNRRVFHALSAPSGHSTLRVVIGDPSTLIPLRTRLAELGCASELSHIPNLIAIDVPPASSLAAVRAYLDEGQARAKWEYETSAIRH